MSLSGQTPQRPLPGAYVQTPAPTLNLRRKDHSISNASLSNSQPQHDSQNTGQAITTQTQQKTQEAGSQASETLGPVERAARTINEILTQETRYPELDNYVGQGISSDYEISSQPAWAPFQKVKMYDIPDKIFDQYNRAQVSTMMGLFADFNHAWVSIDNALYIWNYTHSHPDLIGFEEQPSTITAVRLVVPRAGVFKSHINRLLVVATTAEIRIVGLSSQQGLDGGYSVSLYTTDFSLPIRGVDVSLVEGSSASGRIFFSGRGSDDVYEFTYNAEERWFQNRCAKVNHTSKGLSTFAPSFSFGQRSKQEYLTQIVIDDSRKLLYTLSSRSTIHTFHMKPNGGLDLVISKPLSQTLNNIGHMTSQSELISPNMSLVSINPISSMESGRLHLMTITSTGCRVFMSATSSYGWSTTDTTNAPSSMQVHHVKFPPVDSASGTNQEHALAPRSSSGPQGINASSKALTPTRNAVRYPPGFFFGFVAKDPQGTTDTLFVSGPDSGRIARPQDSSRLSKYLELGIWFNLGSRAEDIGLSSAPFCAASSPAGFGNELAVQYDKAATEVAILTNTGIHTMRRRRLVDMFAAAIRVGGGDEGLEGEVKKFIRLYGRGETASTALAVACGQGLDVTSDFRIARITDPEVLEYARKAFIEFGGKPQFNENSVIDQSVPAIDMVRPSPRHEGLSYYVTRLVRSVWKAPIVQETTSASGGLAISSAVDLTKLREVQHDLSALKEFLDTNKSFIEGLAGPEALGRVSSKQEEVALQAEHRALHSLQVLIENLIEGIAFALVLFDERIEEIVLLLRDETRQRLRNLTYEGLFSTANGKDLAKELVKAIVNRNIANGSNVETVAEALRRRCGSFCSADDVVIFKAQEQIKRASETGSNSEHGRILLNESLRLFKQVAANLSMEQLQWAVQQYLEMQFYAGAIQLALNVAQETDRGNRALTWIQDGRPEQDPRASVFESRKRCYGLIHQVILSLDEASNQAPDIMQGQLTLSAKRRREAYEVVDTSQDEVFQTDLYDWYLAQGRADRLLEIQSPYVVTYLQRKSLDDIAHADLLWKYYSQTDRYSEAATVQLILAKSAFDLPLDRRIEYLSRAKANANSYTAGVPRQARQRLLREVSDLLDVANIQDDLLQRLKADERIAAEVRPKVLGKLDGPILSLSELHNAYADPAGYYDLCLIIYQASDYRNRADIRATWQNLLEHVHQEAVRRGTPLPYEAVVEKIRTLGPRLDLSETMFPIDELVPMLTRYAFEFQHGVGPASWVVDALVDIGVPFESLFAVLEAMYDANEAPFQGRNRRHLAHDLLHLVRLWLQRTNRENRSVLGNEETAAAVSRVLLGLLQDRSLDQDRVEECQLLRTRIEAALR